MNFNGRQSFDKRDDSSSADLEAARNDDLAAVCNVRTNKMMAANDGGAFEIDNSLTSYVTTDECTGLLYVDLAAIYSDDLTAVCEDETFLLGVISLTWRFVLEDNVSLSGCCIISDCVVSMPPISDASELRLLVPTSSAACKGKCCMDSISSL